MIVLTGNTLQPVLSAHIPSITDSVIWSCQALCSVLTHLQTFQIINMKVLSVLAICLSAALAENIKIGDLSNLHHGVSGEVYAADDNTIVIENFKYDGAGESCNTFISSVTSCDNIIIYILSETIESNIVLFQVQTLSSGLELRETQRLSQLTTKPSSWTPRETTTSTGTTRPPSSASTRERPSLSRCPPT